MLMPCPVIWSRPMATRVVSTQVQGLTVIVQSGVGAIPVVKQDKALDATGRPIDTHVQLVTSAGKPTFAFTPLHQRQLNVSGDAISSPYTHLVLVTVCSDSVMLQKHKHRRCGVLYPPRACKQFAL